MTKISKKSAYPIKNPVIGDFFVGTDSENNNKTVSFGFEYAANLINRINGALIVNYMFKTDVNIPLAVLTQGHFLSEENNTNIDTVTKLYVNKTNFQEDDLTDLFLFIKDNPGDYYFKLQNSENLINAVYYQIISIVAYAEYFEFNIAIDKSNPSLTTLVDSNVYFFSFEIKSNITKTSDLINDGENGTDPFITAGDVPEYTTDIVANQLILYKDGVAVTSKDLSIYLDDTNLARLVSGTINPTTGIVTFTRDDASTFTIDFSSLIDVQPANTSDLTNDGADGSSPFATVQEVTDGDTALDTRVTVLENYNPPPASGFTGIAIAVWSGVGLVYDYVFPKYYIEGVEYPAITGSITLTEADPTNPRFTTIIADSNGVNEVLGEAQENPPTPSIDTNTQLFVINILINAGQTTPSNTSQALIYDEGTEWTGFASNGAITLDNTVTPLKGVNCIDVNNSVGNSYFEFTASSTQNITEADGFKFWTKLTNVILANRGFYVTFYNDSVKVSKDIIFKRNSGSGPNSVTTGLYGIDYINTTNYQLIVMPYQDLDFTNSSYNKIRITFISTISVKFDYFALMTASGGFGASNDKKSIKSIVTDNGTASSTIAEDSFSIVGTGGAETTASGKTIIVDVSSGVQEAKDYADVGLATKLDTSAYNQYFKGVYLTEAALISAYPTASVGDRAQVNVVGATEVINYSWDDEAGSWVITGSAGSGALNTDELPEGSTNLYFTGARVLATVLTGLSAVAGTFTATDSLITAFGKIKYLIDNIASTYQVIITDVNFGAFINSLTAKATPIDADSISIVDSADSNKQKKVSLTNFKAFLKTYYDGLYLVPQITITTTVSITTATVGTVSGLSQKGRNTIIDNGVNAINITIDGSTGFCASYVKHGTGAITFVQGAGRTLVQVDATAVFDGAVGSTATVSSVGTTDYLRISNAS